MGHDHASESNERRTFWAALVTLSFLLVEVVGGVVSGSLALLSDAAHMLTDVVALFLAWAGFRIARRPADRTRTYGFSRFQVLIAFVNGFSLFIIVGWIFYEAIKRLWAGSIEIAGGLMLVVAAIGLLVNIVSFLILSAADRSNLNIRGAIVHVLGDLLGSVAALIGAGVILLTGWMPIDPLLSMLVGLIILRSAWKIIKESSHILLEGAPTNLDMDAVGRDLEANVPGVGQIHHVHVWMLTQENVVATLHAKILDGLHPDTVVDQIQTRLRDEYGIQHATVQIEYDLCKNPEDAAFP